MPQDAEGIPRAAKSSVSTGVEVGWNYEEPHDCVEGAPLNAMFRLRLNLNCAQMLPALAYCVIRSIFRFAVAPTKGSQVPFRIVLPFTSGI